MRRYRARVAYDGERYQGFQRQAAGIPTIQGTLEAAIHTVTGQTVTVIGAGRTDTGVHATGQVIAFELDDSRWEHGGDALMRALNVTLPDEIVIQHLDVLPEGNAFHPRFDAVSRLYKYTIIQTPERLPSLHRFAWHLRPALDERLLHQSASLVIGTHDFGAFGKPPRGDNTVRTIHQSFWEQDISAEAREAVVWRYTVEADAFLQHMVRRLVGSMVDVARGAKALELFETVFRGGQLVPHWHMAPPHGLTLVEVKYNKEVTSDE